MLGSITGILAADGSLKPTTAIRLAGVTDPSVVRRLREKLKLQPLTSPTSAKRKALGNTKRSPLMAQKTGEASRATLAMQPLAKPVRPAPEVTEPSPISTKAKSSDASDAADPAAQPLPKPAIPRPDPQQEALRLSAEAAAAMSRLYLHCMNFAAENNPLSFAFRTQAAMGQWMAAMMSQPMSNPFHRENQ